MGLCAAAREVACAYVALVRGQPDLQLVFIGMNFWALRHSASRHLAARAYRLYFAGSVQLLREASMNEVEDSADHESIVRQIVAMVDGAALQFISLEDDVFEQIVELGISDLLDRLSRSLEVGT